MAFDAKTLLSDMKLSLRVDSDEDDELIIGYLTAANGFIVNAVGNEIEGFYELENVEPLVKTSTMALAASYYDYRASLSDVQVVPIDLVVNSIIGTLRGIYTEKMQEVANENA